MDFKLKMGSGGEDGERRKNDGKSKRKMDEEEESTNKKPKLAWTPELHRQFVYVYNQLVDENQRNPTPQEILQRMYNPPPELTIFEISTHLRDYRNSLAQSQQQQHPGNSSRDVAFGQQLSSSTSNSSNYHLQDVQQTPAIRGIIDRRFNNYGYENPNSRLPFGSQSGIPNTFYLSTDFWIGINSWMDIIELAAGNNNRIIISLTALLGALQDHFRQQPPVIGTNFYPRNNNNINSSRQSLVRPFGFNIPSGGGVGSLSITRENNWINNIPVSVPDVSIWENVPPDFRQQLQQINSASRPFGPLRTSRPSISQQQHPGNSSTGVALRTSRPSISQQQHPGNSSTGVALRTSRPSISHRQATALVRPSSSSSVQQNLQVIERIDQRFNNHGYENPNSRLPFGNMNNMHSGGASRNIPNMDFDSQSEIPNNSCQIVIKTIELDAGISGGASMDTIELAAGNNRISILLSALSEALQEHFGQQPPVIGMNIYPRNNNNNNNSRQSLVRPFGDIGSSSITRQNNSRQSLVRPFGDIGSSSIIRQNNNRQSLVRPFGDVGSSSISRQNNDRQSLVWSFGDVGSSSITGQNISQQLNSSSNNTERRTSRMPINSRQSVERPFRFNAPHNYLELGPSSVTAQNIPVSAPSINHQQQLNSSSLPFTLLTRSNTSIRVTNTQDLIGANFSQHVLGNTQEEDRGHGGNGNEDGSGNLPD